MKQTARLNLTAREIERAERRIRQLYERVTVPAILRPPTREESK